MEQLGYDNLISICNRIHDLHDLKSFSEVSKQFLKAACIRRRRLEVSFTGLLTDILPASPNLSYIRYSKPLSNMHMKLLAQSCPKLIDLNLGLPLKKNLDTKVDYESDFNDDGLCAVANAYIDLISLSLRRRLHVGDLGVVSILRSSKNITSLDLARCIKVTDESLKAIGEANRLRSLNLQGCYLITD